MAFRIGRKYASHVYPERAGGGGAASAFARNFATGPKGSPATGVQINWNSIDVGADPDEDVPITALSTGIIVISGAIGVSNISGTPVLVTVQVQVDDVSIGSSFQVTVPDGSLESIPFLAETTPLDTPVGVLRNVQVLVTGAGATTPVDSSAISVQEVSVATG
jgi:hypothetical protein